MNEIVEELIKYRMQITLQELAMIESGWIRKKNYSFIYSGHKNCQRTQRHTIPDYWNRRPEYTRILSYQ
jgi:hypothetical protein